MQLKLHKNLPQIISTLESMRENLLDEDSKDLSQYTESETECNNTISSIQQQIEESQAQYEEDGRDIDTEEIMRESLEAQFSTSQDTLSSKEEELNDLQSQRDNEKEVFEASQADFESSLSALYEGKAILRELIVNNEETLFLQTSRGASKKKKALVDFANMIQGSMISQPGLRGILSFLSQSAQNPDVQADQGLVNKILDLLNLLIEKLEEDERMEKEAEETRVDIFEKEKLSLDEEIAGLRGENSELAQKIKVLVDSVASMKEEMASLEERIKEKTQENEDKITECSALKRNFEERTGHRFVFFIRIINDCL